MKILSFKSLREEMFLMLYLSKNIVKHNQIKKNQKICYVSLGYFE